jgi:hypothetical protein
VLDEGVTAGVGHNRRAGGSEARCPNPRATHELKATCAGELPKPGGLVTGRFLDPANDDAITGQFVQSNLNFDAVAGTTYYFMVGSCCGSDGGNLVFRVDVSVNLGLTIDPAGSVDAKTGVATIRGTVTCSEPVSGTLDGGVQQRVGRALLNGGFFTGFECDGVTPWEVQVSAFDGLFVAGRAQVSVRAFAFDRDFTDLAATVRLKGKGK